MIDRMVDRIGTVVFFLFGLLVSTFLIYCTLWLIVEMYKYLVMTFC